MKPILEEKQPHLEESNFIFRLVDGISKADEFASILTDLIEDANELIKL